MVAKYVLHCNFVANLFRYDLTNYGDPTKNKTKCECWFQDFLASAITVTLTWRETELASRHICIKIIALT